MALQLLNKHPIFIFRMSPVKQMLLLAVYCSHDIVSGRLSLIHDVHTVTTASMKVVRHSRFLLPAHTCPGPKSRYTPTLCPIFIKPFRNLGSKHTCSVEAYPLPLFLQETSPCICHLSDSLTLFKTMFASQREEHTRTSVPLYYEHLTI